MTVQTRQKRRKPGVAQSHRSQFVQPCNPVALRDIIQLVPSLAPNLRTSHQGELRSVPVSLAEKMTTISTDQDQSVPPSSPPLRSIYRTVHSALVAIFLRLSDPTSARSASRLQLWEAGLFEMAALMDTAFESDKDVFQPLRQCILRIPVDMLVWEGLFRAPVSLPIRTADLSFPPRTTAE